MSTPEGLCTQCSATQYCSEHEPDLVASLRTRLQTLETALQMLHEILLRASNVGAGAKSVEDAANEGIGLATEAEGIVHQLRFGEAALAASRGREPQCTLCGEPQSAHTKSTADWRDVPGCTGHYLKADSGGHTHQPSSARKGE